MVKMQEAKKVEAKIPRKILLFVRQKKTMAKLLYFDSQLINPKGFWNNRFFWQKPVKSNS